MIRWDEFEEAALARMGRDISRRANSPQHEAITAASDSSLFLVAGPGSGKTTVIALRILKLIFVDAVAPAAILATTFTRKAAAELRSRILGWGDLMRQEFLTQPRDAGVVRDLEAIDFNQVRSGTLDSISEELLTEFRPARVGAPIVLDEFVARALVLREGLFAHGRHNSAPVRDFLARLAGTKFGINTATISGAVHELSDHFVHDFIDVAAYTAASTDPGVVIACDAVRDYWNVLQTRGVLDFAHLEGQLVAALQSGQLRAYLDELRFVLVDEYQDTNLVQERLYFELARAALGNGGSLAVVGDDDQSLYRFRGATVDLFQEFPARLAGEVGTTPRTIYLSQNYRSTREVIDLVNGFIGLDRAYQPARVRNKPSITFARTGAVPRFPVVGMFRDSASELATDLAAFVHAVIAGNGFTFKHAGSQVTIRLSGEGGSPGDVVLLASSPAEFSGGDVARLPLLLRGELGAHEPPLKLFNPRGQELAAIDSVAVLCGLLLECLDPAGQVGSSLRLPQASQQTFAAWRQRARQFIASNPEPRHPQPLASFVGAWQGRTPLPTRQIGNRENVAVNDLVYKLVTWLPQMQDDVEHLVYLEAITRTITESALFAAFKSEVVFQPLVNGDLDGLDRASVRDVLWNVLSPIATGVIEINEDLLETLPPDRIPVMSIHQAKGLEFPLVIVDVGSDFRSEHHSQAFKRFPRNAGRTCALEDELRPFSPLGRPVRRGLDRAFDDLTRQYFVAYSRAQDVLMLVGLTTVLNGIPNVATGWTRDGTWAWGAGLRNIIHL